MFYRTATKAAAVLSLGLGLCTPSWAGEALFGYLKGAEPLPEGAGEFYLNTTRRHDKGQGSYTAYDVETEIEYGVTDRFTAVAAIKGQRIDTSGLIIDGYLPQEQDNGFAYAGMEAEARYNILKPALDDFGLSVAFGAEYRVLDPHSGQDKDTLSVETSLMLQKYLLDGQLVWAGNIALESTRADRKEIDKLPAGFDWPTEPEMEIEVVLSTGLSYRFMPNWYASIEALYEEEHETEVGKERYSTFAGPSIHYGGKQWWATATYLSQVDGGGEKYANQQDDDLHLIEKTKEEIRLKVGINF